MSTRETLIEVVQILADAHAVRAILTAPFWLMTHAAGLSIWIEDRASARHAVRAGFEARIAALEASVARLQAETERLALLVDEEIEAAEFWGDALDEIANDNAPSEARRIAREALARQPIDFPERIAA